MMCAVKLENLDAYASGDIADEDIIYIEEDDAEGKYVGTEVLIELNADGTVKSFGPSGKSVVGQLSITKEGDKFTVKIGNKVFLDKVDATAKMTTKAYDSVTASAYYVSSATKKSVFAYNSGENLDLQLCFGNDTRDVTTVGIFYDEFYNVNYEGGVDGYDWDGDGKIDLVVVNRPQTGKVTADSNGTSVSVGFLGDNHSYCGCGGWHTQTSYATEDTYLKDDIVFVYEDYKTGTFTIVKPETVTGKLNKVNVAQGKVYIGDKTYALNNTGDLPYVNGKQVTQYETDAQKAAWEAAVTKEITVMVDKLGNILWASLPA